MDIQPVSLTAYNFFLPLVAIITLCLAVIVALDCAWRVEKRLKTFMKLATAALFILLAKKILEITGFQESDFFKNFFQYLDIAVSLFLLASMVEMYKIIRSLDNENPKAPK
jgi:hypothetical protein